MGWFLLWVGGLVPSVCGWVGVCGCVWVCVFLSDDILRQLLWD